MADNVWQAANNVGAELHEKQKLQRAQDEAAKNAAQEQKHKAEIEEKKEKEGLIGS